MSLYTSYFVELRSPSRSSLNLIRRLLSKAKPQGDEFLFTKAGDVPTEKAIKRCPKDRLKPGPVVPKGNTFSMLMDAQSWKLSTKLTGYGDGCLFETLMHHFPGLTIDGLVTDDEGWDVIRNGESLYTENPTHIPLLTLPIKGVETESFLKLLSVGPDAEWERFGSMHRKNHFMKKWLEMYLFREGMLMATRRKHGMTAVAIRRILELGVEPGRLYVEDDVLTLIQAAARFGRRQDVAMLLEGGCPANSHNLWPYEETIDDPTDLPLHKAVESGKIGNVRVLLKAGANLQAQGVDGDTPLHRAAKAGNAAIIQLLLRAGHRTDVANDEGVLPVALAETGLAYLFKSK